MLGFCGINCGNCRAYKGTVSGDLSLLQAAAGSYSNGEYQAKDWACLGCQPKDQPFISKYCGECKIRKCAIEKGVSNCAACASFDGCERLHKFIDVEPKELGLTMRLLHERFVDSHEKLA